MSGFQELLCKLKDIDIYLLSYFSFDQNFCAFYLEQCLHRVQADQHRTGDFSCVYVVSSTVIFPILAIPLSKASRPTNLDLFQNLSLRRK